MFNQSELRRRPTYNELIQEISEDYKVVFPDRRAKFLRDSPYLSYLDNETYLEVEDQQKQLGIQQQTEQTIRQEAAATGQTASVLRAVSTRTGTGGDYLVAGAPSQTKATDPDDFFSPSSPSGEPNIPGSMSMATPELKAALNQSEPKPLNLSSLFADVVDAQPHEQLAEQLSQNLGQISKQMNGGGGSASSSSATAASGSASSSAAAVAMDESAAMEDDKTGIKRKDKVVSEDTKSPAKTKAKAKGMAKQSPNSKAQLRAIIDAVRENRFESLPGTAVQSLTANLSNGLDIPTAIENSVSKGKLDAVQGMQLEKEYENLMADLAGQGGYADMKSDATGKKEPKPAKGGERAVKSDKFKKDYKPTVANANLKRKVNPKTGFVEMGTDKDTSILKSHWNSKGIGYIKDQLELRGKKIPNWQLTGKDKLKKKDLLEMLYKLDKI